MAVAVAVAVGVAVGGAGVGVGVVIIEFSYGVFLKFWYPKSFVHKWIFPYKPSIVGVLPFMETLILYISVHQWEFQDPKMEVPTIYQACKNRAMIMGIYPQFL